MQQTGYVSVVDNKVQWAQGDKMFTLSWEDGVSAHLFEARDLDRDGANCSRVRIPLFVLNKLVAHGQDLHQHPEVGQTLTLRFRVDGDYEMITFVEKEHVLIGFNTHIPIGFIVMAAEQLANIQDAAELSDARETGIAAATVPDGMVMSGPLPSRRPSTPRVTSPHGMAVPTALPLDETYIPRKSAPAIEHESVPALYVDPSRR